MLGTKPRTLATLLAATLALSASGCARTRFDGTEFRDADLTFRTGPVPEQWHQIEVSEARLAFRDEQTGALVAVGGRCDRDGDDVPLEALTQHLFLQFTDRTILSQRLLALDGREALRTELTARLDGVPRDFVVVVLKKDGCVYDFMLIAPPGTIADGSPPFDRFVLGFAALRRP
jgi:hypothetical protein